MHSTVLQSVCCSCLWIVFFLVIPGMHYFEHSKYHILNTGKSNGSCLTMHTLCSMSLIYFVCLSSWNHFMSCTGSEVWCEVVHSELCSLLGEDGLCFCGWVFLDSSLEAEANDALRTAGQHKDGPHKLLAACGSWIPLPWCGCTSVCFLHAPSSCRGSLGWKLLPFSFDLVSSPKLVGF